VGPYSEKLQKKRQALLRLVMSDPNISKDMRIIWKKQLDNLSVDEDEYNKRVKEIYEKLQPWNRIA
jgi:hypothetical protein